MRVIIRVGRPCTSPQEIANTPLRFFWSREIVGMGQDMMDSSRIERPETRSLRSCV